MQKTTALQPFYDIPGRRSVTSDTARRANSRHSLRFGRRAAMGGDAGVSCFLDKRQLLVSKRPFEIVVIPLPIQKSRAACVPLIHTLRGGVGCRSSTLLTSRILL